MNALIAAALFLTLPVAHALDDRVLVPGDSNTPIEWQKVDLEDRLQEKVTRAIRPTLPEKSFVVNVAIELKPKAGPSPVPSGAPATASNRVSLGKLDLEDPIHDADESSLRKLADENNLFRNIAKATVSILIDNSVPDAKQDLVKKLAQSSVKGIAEVEAEVKVEKGDLIPVEPEKPWNARKWMIELKEPIGLLALALIASLVAIVLMGSYRKLELKKLAILEASSAREDARASAEKAAAEVQSKGAEEEVIKVDAHVDAAHGGPEKIEGAHSGFDHLRSLLKEDPARVSALVRQWTKASAKGSDEALALLPQLLSTEELIQIFKGMNLDERKEWKKHLGKSVSAEGARQAESFVGAQIVESMLLPAPTFDAELRESINDLKLSDCVELSSSSPELGSLLVNVLPTAQVARMLALLPSEISNQVAMGSLKFSNEELIAKSSALKEAVTALKSKAKAASVPFLDNAAALLKELGPTKEGSIFAALAESGELALLEETARRFFPAELLLKLPPKLIKACMDRFPLSKRAELIVSREGDEQNTLMECIGAAGSKARDLIDVEIKQVNEDEIRKKRVEKNRDTIWTDFTENARTLLRGSESAAEQADAVLLAWLSQKTNGQLGGQPAGGGGESHAAAA